MNRTASRTTGDWRSLDIRHYLRPFTDFHDLGRKGARIINRAEGAYICDSEGNRILSCSGRTAASVR